MEFIEMCGGVERDRLAAIEAARRQIASSGFAVLTGAGFTDGDGADHAAVLRLAEEFGVPSSRDGGRAVWPVRPRTSDRMETFSQRDGEALLHTDAAYRSDPEPFFALFCVRPATDGGFTRLLRAVDAVAGLEAGILDALRRPLWRWVPPTVFGGEHDVPRSVLGADGSLRWRHDNLDVPESLSGVADGFREHIERHPMLFQLPLPSDAVLLCDNRRVVHGRTTFSDPDRHLLRVRLGAR